MPRFMDFHADLKLSEEAVRQIAAEAKAGTSDEFGVSQVDLFHNPGGQAYCLLEAPDAEAVRKHHEALGLACGDVHQVTGIR